MRAAKGNGEIARLIVAGACGALSPDLKAGDVVVGTEIHTIDQEPPLDLFDSGALAEALSAIGRTVHLGPIACVDRIVGPEEKARLAGSGAIAVEMETARVAAAVGVRQGPGDGASSQPAMPISVIRVVSDSAGMQWWNPALVVELARATGSLYRVGKVIGSGRIPSEGVPG